MIEIVENGFESLLLRSFGKEINTFTINCYKYFIR